jgi:2,3-bisphosphoglycerate-independent phosphoglycerate mutase
MKSASLSLIALALSTASAGMAFAADASTPKTRDQVRAELAEAQRNGTLIADGQTGATLRDLNPGLYAAMPASATTKTRADVKAELRDAWTRGDLVADGQTGATYRDLAPHRYTMQTMAMHPRMSESAQVSQADQLPKR